MVGERNKDLDLEKQRVVSRLESLENTIKESNDRLYVKIYGDPEANPPIEGIEIRLKRIESLEAGREKNKQTLIQTSLGAVTIAVGAIVLWIITVLRNAFIHKP